MVKQPVFDVDDETDDDDDDDDEDNDVVGDEALRCWWLFWIMALWLLLGWRRPNEQVGKDDTSMVAPMLLLLLATV